MDSPCIFYTNEARINGVNGTNKASLTKINDNGELRLTGVIAIGH